MLRIELKKKNKNDNKSAKGSFEYITRSGLSNKDEIAKSTDLIYTSSKIPTFFSKENQFWNEVDKNERKNGRVNSELLISLPREKTTKEKVEMIEEFIEKTLKKNTSYSYAIHEPMASDGLLNPHCHLMIYEKVFPRNFYNEELSKEITKKDFATTFQKNDNYIEKEKSYREKAFIYKARENYEELIYEKGNFDTQKQLEKFAKLHEKGKNTDNEKRFFILQSEQILMKEKGENYMNDFNNLKKSNSIHEIKEYFDNISEEKMEELNILFPEQKDFFELLKNNELSKINEEHNISNEIILQKINDLTIQNVPDTLINSDSDLINLDKNIRETIDFNEITDRYIYNKILTKVFKDDNFDLDNKRFFQLNNFFKELKESDDFKIDTKNYISNSTLEYRKNNENNLLDEVPYRKINVKEIDLEKFELDCIKLENKFNKKEKEFFSNKELVKASKNVIPVRDSVAKEVAGELPFLKAYQENAKYIFNFSNNTPGYAELRNLLFPELQAVFTGAKNPKQALDSYVEQGNRVIEKEQKNSLALKK